MVSIDRNEVLRVLSMRRAEIGDRFGVKRLAVFASFSRGRQSEGSDLDVLVEFSQPATFDGYMNLKFFLEDLLRLKVHLVTNKGLRKDLKEVIEKDLIHVS